MRALDQKLLRDLWHLRGQGLAIAMVMACGVATFVMSLSTMNALERTQARYYERYRFADVFARLKRAPESLTVRIAELPGVGQVQSRVVADVTLDVPGLGEPAIGRLVSIPDHVPATLNRLYLREGRRPEPMRGGEVVVSEGFAHAHQMRPGDSLAAVINGRWQRLRIVGVALSPEYVYPIREGEVFPDQKRFAIVWMPRTELAAAFDMQGAFNDVTLSLMPGVSEAEVVRRLDLLLAPYGGIGSFGRADQVSNRYVTNELRELRTMAVAAPAIFLLVAAFLLNVVVARLVSTQREQIAALKAFGYTNGEVGGHYLKLVLALAGFGALLGIATGAYLGRELTQLYSDFFHFPAFDYSLNASVVLQALLVSGGAAVAGTLQAVRSAVRLPPAEAMRPEPPANYRATFVERIGLSRWLSPVGRMILRQLERRPGRSLMSILGIALAVAVLVIGNYAGDAIDYVMETQFFVNQRYDVAVAFMEAEPSRVRHGLATLPGVQRVEPFRGVAVRLRHGHVTRRTAIMGVADDAALNRVVDIHRRFVALPPSGLVLSEKLAEVLGVVPGDLVTVEVLEGERPVHEVPLRAVIDEFSGLSAYMKREALERLVREPGQVNGAFLAIDPHHTTALYTELKQTPHVASVTVKRATLESFQQTFAENLLRMRLFNIAFASIIAAGVVYNCARIALAERGRDLATLRVIGFTRAEVSAILLGELAVLTLAAIPPGLLIGRGLVSWMVTAYDTELFRLPLVVYPRTYAMAAAVVLLASLLSALVVRRRLDRLDLVAVLKTKE